MKIIYLSWAPFNRRAETFSANMHAENVYIHFFGYRNKLLSPFKYPLMGIKTLWVLFRKKPDVVIGMSPPLFTITFIDLYCRIAKKHFVIDAHTGSLISPPWTRFRKMHQALCQRALTTIVTNDYLKELVESWKGHAMILIPPIRYPEIEVRNLMKAKNLLVVNSYAWDEPLGQTLEAARQFPDVGFYVTGAIHKQARGLIEKYKNVATFTDFISYKEYLSLLKNVNGVLCLTTRDHTLQSGGVEAVYMGKPFLTSDFDILKQLFPLGTVYVNPHRSESIAQGIREMLENETKLSQEMVIAAQQDREKWQNGCQQLNNLIENSNAAN